MYVCANRNGQMSTGDIRAFFYVGQFSTMEFMVQDGEVTYVYCATQNYGEIPKQHYKTFLKVVIESIPIVYIHM